MKPVSASLQLAAANAAAIVASNTPTGAGALTLVSSPWVADVPRRVLVTYGNEASSRTVQITGTDRSGFPLKETVTVPSGALGTVATNNDFATVTQVQVFAAWTAAMSVGTNTVASSAWFSVQTQVTPCAIGIGVTVAGTVDYTVEYTYEDPNALPAGITWPDIFSLSALATKTTTLDSAITQPVAAFRLTVNSGTGTARMGAVQAGVWQ